MNPRSDSELTQDAPRSAAFGAGALVGGLLGALAAYKWRWHRFAERPPIIVKGGSITFEQAPRGGRKHGWAEDEDDDYWTSAQCDGEPIKRLSAEVKEGAKGCGPVEGTKLLITYKPMAGAAEMFEMDVSSGKPRIKQKKGLNAEKRS